MTLVRTQTETVESAGCVEERLAEILASKRHQVAQLPRHYRMLWEAIERTVRGGKKVRPALVLNVHRALSGTHTAAAVDVACAFELLHGALVIHDDVIDHDTVRRGEPNIAGSFADEARDSGAEADAAQSWGQASAILAGDLLLTLAQSLIARADIDTGTRRRLLELFDHCVTLAASGEHSDVRFSMRLEPVSAYDVLGMMEQKTSAYSFQAPLTAAAILAGADAADVELLDEIGCHLGFVYQMRDDVLGVFGVEATTGKSAIGDLREGKETLLIAFARMDASWRSVEQLFGAADLTDTGAARLREMIEQSGAREHVEMFISDRRAEAGRLIDGSHLPQALRDELRAVLRSCAEREA